MAEAICWHLELGGDVVARIADAREYEFPWTYGVVVASPEFDRFRPYFTDPDTWPSDDPAIEALCDEVDARGGFLLRDFQTGLAHQPVTLNQNSAYVWFRIGWRGAWRDSVRVGVRPQMPNRALHLTPPADV